MSDLKKDLAQTSCSDQDISRIICLQGEELIRELRKQRSLLLEKIHEDQRKIDRLDHLIRERKLK